MGYVTCDSEARRVVFLVDQYDTAENPAYVGAVGIGFGQLESTTTCITNSKVSTDVEVLGYRTTPSRILSPSAQKSLLRFDSSNFPVY